MRVLNLLTSGGIGGVERLCSDIGVYSDFENGFCFLTQGGVIYEQMRDAGLQTYDLSPLGRKFCMKKLLKLKRIAKDYDIITVHHTDPFLKLYFLLLKPLKKKMVTVVHSCHDGAATKQYGKCKKRIYDIVFQCSLSASDAVVFVSKAGMKSYQKAFSISEKKIHVIYNGIGTGKIEDGKNHNIVKSTPYHIAYIGRLSSIKGVDLLLKAVKRVSAKWPVQVHIVGDGPDRDKLEALSRQLTISEITCFHGQQLDIASYLKRVSIFVYPSRCQEIFGISIVEAMAYGVPCIASNVGGIPEIIEDGVSGYLFQSENVSDLASKLELVMEKIESDKIAALISEEKKTASKFSIHNTVLSLEKLYAQVLDAN